VRAGLTLAAADAPEQVPIDPLRSISVRRPPLPAAAAQVRTAEP
jgi:hypothetical protein